MDLCELIHLLLTPGLLQVLWTVVKNLDYGLGCCLGFPPFLMEFVRGALPDRGMKPDLIAVSVQSMMPRSLIAFLLVW